MACTCTCTSTSTCSVQTITNLFRDLDDIMKALWKELTLLAGRLTAVARKEPAQLVTVLRIVEREEA